VKRRQAPTSIITIAQDRKDQLTSITNMQETIENMISAASAAQIAIVAVDFDESPTTIARTARITPSNVIREDAFESR